MKSNINIYNSPLKTYSIKRKKKSILCLSAKNSDEGDSNYEDINIEEFSLKDIQLDKNTIFKHKNP